MKTQINPNSLISRITHHALRSLLFAGFSLSAAETNSIGTIQFDRDVRPIFEQSCFRCHGPLKPKSSFRLDDRAAALAGGDDNTNDIVPGHSGQSVLIRYVAGLDEKIQMPPPGRAPPLTSAQVGILKAWIDQGALWGTNLAPPELTFSLAPELRWINVDGNKRKFRELEGAKEGFGGGADEFSVTKQLDPDTKLALTGHVRMPEHDIAATLTLDQNNVGFVHGGFEEWRKYYNDVGGYYPLFQPSTFALDRDLHMDIGRFWIDVGLTPPDKPQVVLGYEYQFRQGMQSMLVWGPVSQAGTTKNIYPDAEDVSEHTHIFKIDLSDTLWGWNVEDRTRIELYHLAEQRNDDGSYTTGPNPDLLKRVDQTVRYTQGANMLRVEKQVTSWWLVSAGGLLSEFDGTTLLNQSAVNASGVPVSAPALGLYWGTDGITLRRLSRVVSAGTLLLPVRGLSVSAGAQGEWTHEDGFGNVDLAFDNPALPGTMNFPFPVNANMDRTEASEDLNLRFTRLPRTVLFAEARGQQESVGQFDQSGNIVDPVEQRTDALNHFYDARTGLTTSPWTWLELGGHYRRRDSSTGYKNLMVPETTTGYPGFITHRDIALDEIEGRIVLRPVSWWNARLTYDRDRTGFSSTTGAVTNSLIGIPILDGRTESDNFSLGLTFTPVPRFYFSGSATYSHSRTTTAAGNNSAAVVPYVGDIWTLSASAGYALNDKTSLSVTYVYSESSYGQNNTAGLPLGLDFTRHELIAGIKRQLTKRLSGGLRYEFSQYVEPSSGNVNNFTAHGVFATLDYRWP